MKYFFMPFFISTLIIAIYSLVKNLNYIIKKLKNEKSVGVKLCNFRRAIPIYQLIIIIVQFFVIYYIESKEITILVNIINVILLIDFIFGLIVKPIMYEDGIICDNGKMIFWREINSINYRKKMVGILGVIILVTEDGKITKLSTEANQCNVIKEMIFNKSGLVSKEIITK